MIPFAAERVTRAAFKADPYPFYARLRADQPVCRVALSGRQEAVLVTRYEHVSALLRDDRFAKEPANAMTPEQLAKERTPPRFFAALTRNMLALDDPDHARLKRLVQAAFTPRRVDQLDAQARAASSALLDRLERRDRFDLIADYALPLPVMVISDLLGVPKPDQARFARWSHMLIQGGADPAAMVLSLPAIVAFMRYLRKLIALKRAVPDDDLVSALVEAEDAGDRLDGDELMAMIAILLSAGHETTTNLIGNGMLALMLHPQARQRLADDRALLSTGIEELLRFASPAEMATHRYAREDVMIAGHLIPRGTLVLGVIASANRDEQQFANPDMIDLARAPNRHLTFGEGGHYCVGASLARLEGRVAFGDLFDRMPQLKLAVPARSLAWRPGLVLRGLKHLPVERRGF
jgi:cytochrome P450 PksS